MLLFKPSSQFLSAPRWGIYSNDEPFESFTVLASKDGQVVQHTGVNLTHQFENTLMSSALAWPRRTSFFRTKPRNILAAWVLPDSKLSRFEWACSPSWGPQDVEAECRLEAGARSQVSIHELALDYIVYRSPEGNLSVKVWHCPQTQVDALAAQTQELGLQLTIVTVKSQVADLANFFGLQQGALPC